jgi:hypothetical protein
MIRPPATSFKGQVACESFAGRDKRRGKGKRGGLRVIYFYWIRGLEFWLFTLYDKNEVRDLPKKDRATLEGLLKAELKMRKPV